MMKEVNMIVAIGNDGAIGRKGELIWKIPADLKRFKELTTGHPVIMGRKTWESLPKKPLPNRINIVITRQPGYKAEGGLVVSSPDEALSLCQDVTPFIIGGAEIYKSFLPKATGLFLTKIDQECEDADSFLNLELGDEWEKREESPEEKTPDGITYRYMTYKR